MAFNGASMNATVGNDGSTVMVNKHAGHNTKTRSGAGCQLCGAKYSKTVQTYEHPANPSSIFTGNDGRGTGGF
jgi:hypothetical protein